MSPSVAFATDLSVRSHRPLGRAVQLAEQFGARLIIIHALELHGHPDARAREADARKKLLELTTHIGIPFECILEHGSAPEIIAEVAAKQGSALIVVGPARYNDVSDFVLGTAVDYLLQHATVPVLLVKEKPVAEYDALVVGTDFSKRSMAALLSALTLFEGIPALVVHAYEHPFSARAVSDDLRETGGTWESERMSDFLNHPDIARFAGRMDSICVESTPANAIETVTDKFHHPLAVLGAHSLGRFAKAVLGNRVSNLLATISRDVLVVREDNWRAAVDRERV